MLSRFARTLILLAVAGVAYAGPVAACVCAADAMDEMPCCPDNLQHHGQSNCPQPDSGVNAVCDPAPADFLSAGSLDLSLPIAISAALRLWFVPGPPISSIATSPSPHDSPPIYLITGRLRI
jgi:hypothetical protein